jgi:hypothetical protein
VQVRRPNAQAPVAGLQGNLSQFRGDGDYTFLLKAEKSTLGGFQSVTVKCGTSLSRIIFYQ